MADTRIVIVDGVVYNIIDHSTGTGLSLDDMEDIIRDLHGYDSGNNSFTNGISDDIANSSNPFVDVHIDRTYPSGDPYGTQTFLEDPNFPDVRSINMHSDDFRDDLRSTYVDTDGNLVQADVDMAFVHEMAHLHQERVGEDENGDGIADPHNSSTGNAMAGADFAAEENYAIDKTNDVRQDLGLTERKAYEDDGDSESPDDVKAESDAQTAKILETAKGFGTVIDIDESGGDFNRVSEGRYNNDTGARSSSGTDTRIWDSLGVWVNSFWTNTFGPPDEGGDDNKFSSWTAQRDAWDDLIDSLAELKDAVKAGINYIYDSAAATFADIAEWVQDTIDQILLGINSGSPLVLDLDNDGIELVSLDNTNIYWDIDEDGQAEATGWVDADDGFLAIDLNSDGVITDHTELFGSLTEDGFTALSTYDSNTDNVINSNDTQFSDLLVWQDVNQNGFSEATELFSLSDLDIVSIDLNATVVSQTNEGHTISHTSSFTVDDGVSGPQTQEIVDVWFQFDNVNTDYVIQYTLDPRAALLPTVRGYGLLPDLFVSTSIDNDETDPNSLMSLLTEFSFKEVEDYFVDDGSILTEVQNILYRWAGVDSVDPTSRGPHVNAQKLEFLEELYGENIWQQGYLEDPGGDAGEQFDHAFDIALQALAPRLILQTHVHHLFLGDYAYDATSDSFIGITGLNTDTITDLQAKAEDASQISDKVAFWGDVVRVIDQTVGVSNLSTADQTVLENAIIASDATLTTQQILDVLEWDSHIGEVVNGTSGADTYSGTVGDDTFYAAAGNDTFNGGIGDDFVNGQSGNDTLDGQSGNDTLWGDSGSDTYLYSAGQGDDTIKENSSGTDKIVFGAGITFSDLTFTRVSNEDVRIDVTDTAGGGSVTIEDQFRSTTSGIVETLEFADTSTVDLDTISYTYYGTNAGEILKGIRYGGAQDDTIYGLDGDDTIYGYMNVLDTTNNFLYGGNGNDLVYGASGVDYIEGNDGDDELRGNNGDDDLRGGNGIDTLRGGNQADTLYGEEGNDILYGDNHNDTLLGGLGADELTGGGGNDTFTFANGESFDAVDTIKDYHASYDYIDISDLLSAYDPLTDVITDFVQITDDGTDSTIAVDADGGADAFIAIALVLNETGMTDEAALEGSGKLITV